MKALVFSAHPDDAEFAMGGTLLLLSKKHSVTLVVWTDGGAGTYGDAPTRRKEQEEAAKMLGAKLLWLANPDCSLEHNRNHILRTAQIIRDEKPDAIFAPHWYQPGDVADGRAHPDHRNMGLVVKDAARFARFNIPELKGEKHKAWQVYWYMTPDEIVPKICVHIDEVVSELKALWKIHKSQNQLAGGNLTEALLAWRAGHARPYKDIKYAELFDCDKAALVNIDNFF